MSSLLTILVILIRESTSNINCDDCGLYSSSMTWTIKSLNNVNVEINTKILIEPVNNGANPDVEV